MTNLKTTLDRERLSTETIAEKQDFKGVLESYNAQVKIESRLKWVYGGILGTVVISGLYVAVGIQMELPVSSDKPVSALHDTKATPSIPKKDHEILAVNVDPSENAPIIQVEDIKRNSVELVPDSEIENNVETFIEERSALNFEIENNAQPVVSRNGMPSFGSYFTGEVPLDVICGNEGIESGSDLAVISYTISYFSGNEMVEKKIKGHRVPFEVCEELGRYNLGETIRITEIRGEDRSTGRQSWLPSMHVTPVETAK